GVGRPCRLASVSLASRPKDVVHLPSVAGSDQRGHRRVVLSALHSLIRVNLRNHRKITVVDGRVGFTGGMNIGDDYLGKNPRLGYWRDCFMRLEGPAVSDLQRVFSEDWEFARRETLADEKYAPPRPAAGEVCLQIADSGPDQQVNTIREIYFLAIVS